MAADAPDDIYRGVYGCCRRYRRCHKAKGPRLSGADPLRHIPWHRIGCCATVRRSDHSVVFGKVYVALGVTPLLTCGLLQSSRLLYLDTFVRAKEKITDLSCFILWNPYAAL